MYLYTPIDGRSVAVGEFIISSTGMQFDEPMLCLEEVVGKLLKRSSEDWNVPIPIEPVVTPKFEPEPVLEPVVK